MIKVLNLYAGIGGNRRLWRNVSVTAVELDPDIAKIYKTFFPNDNVIVADAHQYLLEHYDDGWDFIWASPPCPTHSRIRNMAGVGCGQNKPVYPDMKLYEEIIFLQQIYNSTGCSFSGKYCVENVKSYYEPLIEPREFGNHYYWTNFPIGHQKATGRAHMENNTNLQVRKGFNLDAFKIDSNTKRKILRNCVEAEEGKHIFECAFDNRNKAMEYW